jgi:hypothetical protein
MFHVQNAFEEISRGDKSACELLGSFYLWVHNQDDLIDKDKDVKPCEAVGFNIQILRAFAKNTFFQAHQDFLWPVILTSALSYIASEDRKGDADVVNRITAQVLKSEYMNVFFAIAFCVAGWDHALAMSRKYRDYSFDVEVVKV